MKIKLISYNIAGGNNDRKRTRTGEKLLSRADSYSLLCEKMSELINSSDKDCWIICLQEINIEDPECEPCNLVDDFANELRNRTNLAWWKRSCTHIGYNNEESVAVFSSQYIIKETIDKFMMPAPKGERGGIFVDITVEGKPLSVSSVHTTAESSGKYRTKQLHELNDHANGKRNIERKRKPILAGDFNQDWDHPMFQRFKDDNYVNLSSESSAIDFFVYNIADYKLSNCELLDDYKKDGKLLSDHRGIIVTIE